MTKLETILKLAAIRAVITLEPMISKQMLTDLIEELSESFQQESDLECDHIYARKVCIYCGNGHHD